MPQFSSLPYILWWGPGEGLLAAAVDPEDDSHPEVPLATAVDLRFLNDHIYMHAYRPHKWQMAVKYARKGTHRVYTMWRVSVGGGVWKFL